MRTIKFRGVTPRGETVYGDLSHHVGYVFINDKRVVAETVAQLCGYDSNDNEVYEGDTVIAHGKESAVVLSPLYGRGMFKDLTRCTIKKERANSDERN